MTRHLRVTGARRADRAADLGEADIVARCHRRLRGPYTGIDTVLREVLPAADPALVDRHRVELLYGLPELAELVGPAPRTLASDAPFRERTRFFGAGMVRCMSQGIVTFLLDYARAVRAVGAPAPVFAFEEVHEADPTMQELVALLVRRADPDLLRVLVADDGGALTGELPAELRAALAGCDQRSAAAGPDRDRPAADLVAAYVDGDGTSDDPAEIAAYAAAAPDVRRARHDRRADALEPDARWGTRTGALAYHREHGSDPGGAGVRALRTALQFCVETGFSAAVVDLGERGRAVCDPVTRQPDYCEFTNQAAAALVPLGKLEESLALYEELRGRYALPKVHMTTSYAIAMMHTRFLRPRDHERAMQWQQTAVAIAGLLPDPTERLVFGVFQDNALALIEMHRRNLGRALELVDGGIARLDAELGEGDWTLHRSQLLYNRARLLAALGRSDEATTDYSTLIELDPYYTDYLSERAKVARGLGDLVAALADYDRAVELAPPFPELFHNRATARMDTGDVEGALADFAYVLEMEPADLETRLSRAELFVGLGELDAAEADVRAGLVEHPREPRLLCMRGTVAVERQAWQAALESLDAALAADPAYPAALVNRAVARHELGQHEAAVADLTAALATVGDDPDLLLNRGLAHEAAGQVDLAVADWTQALGLPAADAEALHRCLDRTRPAQPAGRP